MRIKVILFSSWGCANGWVCELVTKSCYVLSMQLFTSHSKAKPFIANNSAIAGWVFISIWFLFVAVFTQLLVKTNGTGQFDYEIELAIFGLFWLAGFAGANQLFRIPITKIYIEGKNFRIVQIWPIKRKSLLIPKSQLPAPRIKTDFDSDGSTYHPTIHLADKTEICIGTFFDIADAQSLSDKLIAQIKS